MYQVTISGLPGGSSITGGELIEVEQNGVSVKLTLAQLFIQLLGQANTFTAQQSVAGAANTVNINGSTAGNPVTIGATGSDTNVSLNFTTQGSGSIMFNGASINSTIQSALSGAIVVGSLIIM